MPGPARQAERRAFTLVEILIVVVILGILAAIVTPVLAGATEESRRGAFIESLHGMVEAAEIYQARTGQYIPDTSSGVYIPEFDGLIRQDDFESPTPIGGVWDTEFNDSGILSAVGVHFDGTGETRDDAYMLEVDIVLDDGDLTTGSFRRLGGGRYYSIIEE